MLHDALDAHQADLAVARLVRRGATSLAARARAERPGGGLTLTTVGVLGLLARHGAMTPGEIAGRLRAAPQSLTRTFRALEQAGHVERTTDPDDRRQALLAITGSGRRALAADMAPRDAWLHRVMAAELTEAERELLAVAAKLMLRLADVDAAPGGVER